MVSKLESAALSRNHHLAKVRGLYQLSDESSADWETRRRHVSSLSNLSLFHQYDETTKEETASDRDFERPVTPISDSVKVPPKTYSALAKLIHRRINPRHDWEHISMEDQSSLGGVIMGEVNAIWPELRRQVADPFLTNQQNKELQKRITIHCVTVCEHLFMHYAHKIKALNRRGIFSNQANMSRIRAQLALDAGKYLDVLSVRRHIISDLKKPQMKEVLTFDREETEISRSSPVPTHGPKQLSFHQLVKSSRPKQKLRYQFNLNAELQSLQTQMPSISASRAHPLLPAQRSHVFEEENDEESISEQATETDEEESPYVISQQRPKHRCPSEPMAEHELILDELKHRIEDEESISRSPSQLPSSRLQLHSATRRTRPDSAERPITSLGLATVERHDSGVLDTKNPSEDLRVLVLKQKQLQQKEKDERRQTEDENSYIPPLIQALTRLEEQNAKTKKLKLKAQELDKKREEEEAEIRKPLPEPKYPQPSVVQAKLPGISNPVDRTPVTIRASDIKVADRVDLSHITIEYYNPIYNDLSGEISQATVKELDSNLFQGGELREVYSEIMKTVPNIHQHYDNDPVIVTPGSNVDLSKILASSTLVRPRSQQVINPNLRRDERDVPWEEQQMAYGRRAGMQRAAIPGSEFSSQLQAEAPATFHQFSPSQLNHSIADKGSRAYASWLQWWKNTINTDDYFKYLSTQDTDFLSVLFHFYGSDVAESVTDTMRTAKLEAQRERDRKIAELKREKEEYVPGLWNVKAVTLGGLGKDPEVEDEGFSSDFDTPQTTDRSQSSSHTPRIHTVSSVGKSPRSSKFKKDCNSSIKKIAMTNLSKQHGTHIMNKAPVRFTAVHRDDTNTISLQPVMLKREVLVSSRISKNYKDLEGSTSSGSSYHCTTSYLSTSGGSSDQSVTDTSDLSSVESLFAPIPRSGAGSNKQGKSSKYDASKSDLKIEALQLHNERNRLSARGGTDELRFESMSSGSTYAQNKDIGDVSETTMRDGSFPVEEITDRSKKSVYDTEESTSGYYSGTVAVVERLKLMKDRCRNGTITGKVHNGEYIEDNSSLSDSMEPSAGIQGLSDKEEASSMQQSKVQFAEVGRKVRLARKAVKYMVLDRPVETSEFLQDPDSCSRIMRIVSKKLRRSTSSRRSVASSRLSASEKSGTKPDTDDRLKPTLQERLEVVWRRLKMPESYKLDLALKYSTDAYIKMLPEIVSSWERITDLIIRREQYMSELEKFEKDASDPNRFFERGRKGSSAVRLDEAKTRASLYRKLEVVESTIKRCLLSIKSRFSDVVTYSGRDYKEKMGWDKVEMLYWLQQERRCTMLRDNGRGQQLDLFLHHGNSSILSQPGRKKTQLPLKNVDISVPE